MKSIRRRDFIKTGLLASAALSLPYKTILSRGIADKPPNIVLIFCDDMGYSDVGCFGAKEYKTPNIDSLAKKGIRFTNFYASQGVCSASRASLLTGCYSERVSIKGALNHSAQTGLNPEETTIASMLKKQGYSTAVFGKWHLGHHKEFLPDKFGFDEFLGLPYSNDMWPVDYDGNQITKNSDQKNQFKINYPALYIIEGTEKTAEVKSLEDQNKLTTLYTGHAIDFINRNKEKPFFLYLPHSMPHVPLGVSEKFRGKSGHGLYGDVIMEIDWSVGEIQKSLKDCGIEDNTIIIFTSDNGPWLNFGNNSGTCYPLREGKGTAFEGGVRVPCIIKWPDKIKENIVTDKIASTIDVLPTLAQITGSTLPEKKIDGVNLLPLLTGEKDADPRDSFFFYYDAELRGVREGKWKLMFPHKSVSYENSEPGSDRHPGTTKRIDVELSLFDLENDIGERNNLAAYFPAVVKELSSMADVMRDDLGDVLTKRNGKGVRPPGRRGVSSNQKINHLAVGKNVTIQNRINEYYPAGGPHTLVDGIRGSYDYNDNCWLGFDDPAFEAVIDLGEVQPISSLTAGFLQGQISWIFLPESVEFYLSSDGKAFKSIGIITNELKPDTEALTKDYTLLSNNEKARYVKVLAKSIGKCPDWHPGAEGDSWIFIDEIIIN